MEVKTTVGSLVFAGVIIFALGAQYGYHKTRERLLERRLRDYE